MKRIVLITLIVVMLLVLVFPLPIHSEGPIKTPFDYITPEEQAYVQAARSFVTLIKNKIDNAITDMKTAAFQDTDTWRAGLKKQIGDINNALKALQDLDPHVFLDAHEVFTSIKPINLLAASYAMDPVTMLAFVDKYESDLNNRKNKLDDGLNKITKLMESIAKQKMAVEEVNSAVSNTILESCNKGGD